MDQPQVDDTSEKLANALYTAVGVIWHFHRSRMAGMAIEEEVERSWRNYLETSPEMRQIIAALNGR